ncbi:MAG: 30S ribosomal protein S3 [Candidatus Paceibacterota bacterium]|jgi:small subunit ribosomal protein S3
MPHKVHPKAFRLKGLEGWGSRWFNIKKTPQYLEEDFRIRELLKEKIGKLSTEKVDIERFQGKTVVIIYSGRPGLIIGRGGEGIESLRALIDRKIMKPSQKKKEKRELKIEIREIKDPWASAALSAQWIAQQIEKRMPHRKTIKQAIEKIMASRGNQGARIEVAGRLGGAEIARREWLKRGRLPRSTMRADIDYALETAMTTYGTIGVKVWIFKGEKFE